MRFGRKRYPEHVRGRCHLEIQRLADFGLEARHIVVADVTAVLAQMRCDAVGAGSDGDERGTHRIRPRPAPRITQGCDMVDVNSEAQWKCGHVALIAPIRRARA